MAPRSIIGVGRTYWAWDGDDYYWVPGTWVESPEIGFLWTPGYWGWGGNAFFFHEGYWGPHVGYYGGINYGFGYGGHGYEGGRWENNHFYYNTSVNRINNENIHNTYNTRVEYNSGNRVSYNGGNGGINERPSSQEETYDKERHIGPVAAQNQHVQQARSNRSCAPPRIRASLLSQPRLSLETLKAAQYLPRKLALLTKVPNGQRLGMKLVQPTLMQAKFSPTNTRRRAPARLKRTRNINNSKTS